MSQSPCPSVSLSSCSHCGLEVEVGRLVTHTVRCLLTRKSNEIAQDFEANHFDSSGRDFNSNQAEIKRIENRLEEPKIQPSLEVKAEFEDVEEQANDEKMKALKKIYKTEPVSK